MRGGLREGTGKRLLTDEQERKMKRLRESYGLSYAQLGRRFGIHPETVRLILKRV